MSVPNLKVTEILKSSHYVQNSMHNILFLLTNTMFIIFIMHGSGTTACSISIDGFFLSMNLGVAVVGWCIPHLLIVLLKDISEVWLMFLLRWLNILILAILFWLEELVLASKKLDTCRYEYSNNLKCAVVIYVFYFSLNLGCLLFLSFSNTSQLWMFVG